MPRFITLCLMIAVTALLIISCSSSRDDAVAPPMGNTPVASSSHGGTLCLGLWQVAIEEKTGDIDIVDLRSGNLILNALGFLEPPALKNLTIDFNTLVIDNPIIEVDVTLTHPIPDPAFKGFDVRGVVFGPEVSNADGLTIIPSPEYFTGVSFGYINGLLGTSDGIANYNGLAGYRYFCDGLTLDEDLAEYMSDPPNLGMRGVFSQGPVSNSRHFVLDWADVVQDFFVFNYAIYANFDWPVGEPPYDIEDFNITTANSAEAFCCRVTELANSLYYNPGTGGGGSISLEAEIWDWQLDIDDVTIESLETGVIGKTSYNYNQTGNTAKSIVFGFTDVPADPTSDGELDILITVTDPRQFGETWLMGLLPQAHKLYDKPLYNCFLYTTIVTGCPEVTITSIDPDAGKMGDTITNATITGSGFQDGSAPPKEVKLTMGVLTISGENVDFHDASTIYADFDIPDDAGYLGDWFVEVTNGCGNHGTSGMEIFEVRDSLCGTMDPFTSGGYMGDDSAHLYVPNGALGPTCTRIGDNIMLVGRPQDIQSGDRDRLLSALDPDDTWDDANCIYAIGCPADRYVVNSTGIPCASDNTFYYAAYKLGYDFEVFKMQWNDGSPGSWGSYSQLTELPNDAWRIRRVAIDDEDNPILLAFDDNNHNSLEVLHYDNGTGIWDEKLIPEGDVGSADNIYGFAWNPYKEEYVIAQRITSVCNLLIVDGDGDLVDTISDIFDFSGAPVDWYPALYIDPDASEQCHVVAFGKYTYDHPYQSPFVRYDANYEDEITAEIDFGAHDPYHCPGPAYPNIWGGDCGVDASSTNKRLYFPGYDTTPGYHNKYIAYADLPPDW